jgi:prepilin-type N-terminal cleavage/methylation domain-containing protein
MSDHAPAVATPRTSAGFTLLEVMVAILLTGIVALVGYAAARVSIEARARVGTATGALQAERATRELLRDVLRNVRAPQLPGEPGFALRDERLSFTAAGAGPPFDPEYDWRITIEPDSGGLALRAEPVGRASASRVALRLAGVTRWEVRVLAPNGADWRPDWSSPRTTPRGIAITMWDGSSPAGIPLLLALSPTRTSIVEDALDQ